MTKNPDGVRPVFDVVQDILDTLQNAGQFDRPVTAVTALITADREAIRRECAEVCERRAKEYGELAKMCGVEGRGYNRVRQGEADDCAHAIAAAILSPSIGEGR